jgi:DNA-binding transcriptional MerR regulator
VGERGRGVYGFYDATVVDMIKRIIELKRTGLTLEEIKKTLDRELIERCLRIFEHLNPIDSDVLESEAMLESLNWWDDDVALETVVLEQAIKFTRHLLWVSSRAIRDLIGMAQEMPNDDAIAAIKLIDLFRIRNHERYVCQRNYCIRLADIKGCDRTLGERMTKAREETIERFKNEKSLYEIIVEKK